MRASTAFLLCACFLLGCEGDDGSGTSGGAAGSGGTTGTAGSGGVAGSTGSAGSGGTAGTAGSAGGMTGTGGQGGAGGGTVAEGDPCGESANGATCMAGLVCCYPCGIPDCKFVCTVPCRAGDPACSEEGCPLVP